MVLDPPIALATSPFAASPPPRARSVFERVTGARRPLLARQAVQNLLATTEPDDVRSSQIEEIANEYRLSDLQTIEVCAEVWRSAFESFLRDGVLDPAEQAYLLSLRGLLDISEQTAMAVEKKLVGSRFEKALQAVTNDAKITDAERIELDKLAAQLAIDPREIRFSVRNAAKSLIRPYVVTILADGLASPEELAELDRRLKEAKIVLEPELCAKILTASKRWNAKYAPLDPVPASVRLEQDEMCFLERPTGWSEVRKRRSRGETYDELTLIGRGTLCITNRRALFIGETKSSLIAFKDIAGFTTFTDGMRVERRNGRHIFFDLPQSEIDITATVFLRARNGDTGTFRAPVETSVTLGVTRSEPLVEPRAIPAESNLKAVTSEHEAVLQPLDELKQLVGLDSVKEEVAMLTNLVRIQQARKAQGLPVPPMTHHLIFTGNPGTGKTAVARIISRIYRDLTVLQKGHLIEVDRAQLVGGYLGQTAIKTQAVIESAMGGVLFIDEAYSLTGGRENDNYGREATDTLLKLMEDRRDDFIVIVAGYAEPMQRFIESNPGLQSRFARTIRFPDYGPQELAAILRAFSAQAHYVITPGAEALALARITALRGAHPDNFGNARTVRTLFERMLQSQSNRLATDYDLTREDLVTLTEADVPNLEHLN